MTSEAISSAMNYIDADLIFLAEDARNKKRPKGSKTVLRLCIAAAGFVFIAASALVINSVINSNLPMLELSVDFSGGMSFEGYFLKNADDLISGNPWKKATAFTRLPVYANNAHDEKGTPCALSEKELDGIIRKAAAEASMTVTNITKSYANDLYGGYEKDFVYAVNAEAAEGMITANAAGGITVSFNEPVTLPFDFTPSNRNDGEKATDYFSKKYSSLISKFINFESPAYSVSYQYNVYGEITGTFVAYDSSGSNTDDILNYNLQFAEFRLDKNGSLTSFFICNSFAGAKEIARYPIISSDKAEKELINGNFISSVPYDFPGKEYIAGFELIYKSGKNECIAPYYRFIVELPEAPENGGLRNYGVYYVPAISEKYISEIKLIDSNIQ